MIPMDNPQGNLSQKSPNQVKKGLHPDRLPSLSDHQPNNTNNVQPIHHYSQPASHPNFDPSKTMLDPNRPLSDIPNPVRRGRSKLDDIYNLLDHSYEETVATNDSQYLSAWDLIASPSLASHLELLQAGGLIQLPPRFFKKQDNATVYPLLPPLTKTMPTLLDMADIYNIGQRFRVEGFTLSRYGLTLYGDKKQPKQSTNLPEILNDVYAPDWEFILHPEYFDNGIDSIETDIVACSVAVYVLSHCHTQKTVNKKITAKQICQHMRSYVLSQCRLYPLQVQYFRQIRMFEGHVLVAAKYLGMQTNIVIQHDDIQVYFNLSSPNSLFVRYPNFSDYFINGWQ